MGFKVDEQALSAFAELLNRGADQVKTINRNTEKQDVAGGGPVPGDSGWLFDEVYQFNMKANAWAAVHLEDVEAGYRASAAGMDEAAAVYRKQDDAAEADFDSKYERVKGDVDRSTPEIPWGRDKSPESLFADADHVDVNVHDVDTDGIRAAAGEVQRWIDDKFEYLSSYGWIDWALRELTGYNLRKEVIDAIVGDWEAFAEAGEMWKKCGNAHEALASNAEQYRFLNYFWEGNAADSAQVYFKKFTAAVRAEVPFYHDYLYPSYQNIVQKMLDAQKSVDFIVGYIVDTVTTLGLGGLAKAPQLVSKISDLIGTIGEIWGGVAAASSLEGAGEQGVEAGTMPESEMTYLVYPHGRSYAPSGYLHPGAE